MELLTHHVLAAARSLATLRTALASGDHALAMRVRARLASQLVAVDAAHARIAPAERAAAARLVESLTSSRTSS